MSGDFQRAVFSEMFQGIVFEEAPSELRPEAVALIDEAYLEELGHIPDHGEDAGAVFLIASDEAREVVAAVRIIGPEARPFVFESVLREEGVQVDPIQGERAAVVGRLAVSAKHRRVQRHNFVQIGMLKAACEFSVSRDVTLLLSYTIPRLARLYKRLMFSSLGVSFVHPDVREEMELLGMRLGRDDSAPGRRKTPLGELLFEAKLPNFRFGE